MQVCFWGREVVGGNVEPNVESLVYEMRNLRFQLLDSV